MNSNTTYYSLENNLLGNQQMTPLEKIYPNKEENIKNQGKDYACMHCHTQNNNNNNNNNKEKRQLVLNRGIYADYLEPEYYRYNKSIKMDIDDVGRKYMQYKPRRPKCPIIYNKLFNEVPKSHLIVNPLYNYPIPENMKQMESNWQHTLFDRDKNFVKSITDMMDEMDNAYVL
jgi:hypothetical protein